MLIAIKVWLIKGNVCVIVIIWLICRSLCCFLGKSELALLLNRVLEQLRQFIQLAERLKREEAAQINLERNLEPAEIFCFPDIFFSNKEVPDAFALFGFHQQTRFISSQFYTVQIAGYLKVCFSICYLFSIGNQTDIWQEKQNIHWWSSLLFSVCNWTTSKTINLTWKQL